jgi:putative transposase
MRLIDEQFPETPWYGSRQMARYLRRSGWCVGRHRVRRLMTRMGLAPIYQRPKTSEPHPRHKIYPYLLRQWRSSGRTRSGAPTSPTSRCGGDSCTSSRSWTGRAAKVLAWRLSITMDTEFCVAVLEEAIARYGRPDILNTDQGSQFTSFAFTNTLKDAGTRHVPTDSTKR